MSQKCPCWKYSLALVIVGIALGQASLQARIVPDWPYDKLWHDADVVVIIEPLRTEKNEDKLKIPWCPKEEWQGLTTHFKVHGILKGGSLSDQIIFEHFDYKPNPNPTASTVISDGPFFVRFTPGPLSVDETISKDGKVISHLPLENQIPMFLAFLKKTPTGAFIAVTGQVDPAFSFKELREVFPSWMN